MPIDFSGFSVEVDHGDNVTLDFAVVLNNAPQAITGWTIWFTAKRRLSDPDPGVIQKSTAGGGVSITDAPGGIGFVAFGPLDTAGLPEERTVLYADLQGKDGAGNVYTLAKGQLIVRGDATQTIA